MRTTTIEGSRERRAENSVDVAGPSVAERPVAGSVWTITRSSIGIPSGVAGPLEGRFEPMAGGTFRTRRPWARHELVRRRPVLREDIDRRDRDRPEPNGLNGLNGKTTST